MGEVQAASKPSVPEFTVQYNEQFYNIPDKESIDTYTGKTVIIPGYSAINRTIDIIIKNPHSSSELYYNVRYKGHYGTSEADDAWQEIFPRSDIGGDVRGGFPAQSGSEYTTLSFILGEELHDYIGSPIGGSRGLLAGVNYFYGMVIDIQVEATAVTVKEEWHSFFATTFYYRFVDELSGWSGTKTVSIPEYKYEASNQSEPTPNPTYTSDQPSQTEQPPQTEMIVAGFSLLEFSLVIILCTTLPVLVIALIYTRKTSRHKQETQT